jgi:hypothetical protein
MGICASLHWQAKLSFMTIVLFNTALFAQYNGNIQGVVFDPNGAVVNGASIQLRNVDTGVIAVTTTSDAIIANRRAIVAMDNSYIGRRSSGRSHARCSAGFGLHQL